jgi:hypothetical protein
MELTSCNPSGFQNLQVATRCSENVCTPDLTHYTYPYGTVKTARVLSRRELSVQFCSVCMVSLVESGPIVAVLLSVLCAKFNYQLVATEIHFQLHDNSM